MTLMKKRNRPLRVSIGRELQRFGRRLAATSWAGDTDLNHRVYDKHTLDLMLNRIHDLPDVKVNPNRRPTINVLVPAFDFESMSAGFFGVFQVARFMRTTGWNVRLVLFDNFLFCPDRFRRKFGDFPGMEDLLDEVEVEYIGERKAPLDVSPDDVCMATVWYSAWFARKIGDALGGRRFLYLVQDYETCFFPGGSLFAVADETYAWDYAALFSTSPLQDYFVSTDVGGFASRGLPGISFDNACSARLPPRDEFLAAKSATAKRKLVFYSRPCVDRNMFTLAALSLVTAYERGIFTPDRWDCIGMGLGAASVELLPDLHSTALPRMTLREYERTVEQFDVCLTLMASPHPSLIPMDLAGSGSMVVTNTFRTKTAGYLRGLCGNIIPVAPSVPAIVDGLAAAARASADFPGRHARAAAMRYPRSWEESLGRRHTDFVTEHVLAPALAASRRPRACA